jgi:DNA-binding beta-propeller fold protein YncE
MRYFVACTTVLGLLLFAGGCGAPTPSEVAKQASDEQLIWPRPPAEPRIRYLRSVSGPQDWGIAKPFFRRLFDALAGRPREHFIRPTGVAERDGVLCVADPGAQALWILDSKQRRSVKVDKVGSAVLVSPVAVAMGPDGAIFVADSWLKKVFLLDRKGKFIRVAAQEGLDRPSGLAYDPAMQQLFVVDAVRHRVTVYDPGVALIRTWGERGIGDGELNHPTHIALGPAGTLLVTDALNFRIQAFDREGRFLWKLGHHGDGSGDLAAPKGLGLDSVGHLYVVDALFDAVQIFDRDGTFLLAFGERGIQAGQFWLPNGVFIDPQDQIYVADAYNQRVQVFLGGLGEDKEANR